MKDYQLVDFASNGGFEMTRYADHGYKKGAMLIVYSLALRSFSLLHQLDISILRDCVGVMSDKLPKLQYKKYSTL